MDLSKSPTIIFELAAIEASIAVETKSGALNLGSLLYHSILIKYIMNSFD